MITVVHVHHSAFDHYIGRPHREFPRGSAYENPFHIGKDGDRKEVLEKFRVWWYAPEQEWLRQRALQELRDKRIGCWCKDPKKSQSCHGDIIAEFVNGN